MKTQDFNIHKVKLGVWYGWTAASWICRSTGICRLFILLFKRCIAFFCFFQIVLNGFEEASRFGEYYLETFEFTTNRNIMSANGKVQTVCVTHSKYEPPRDKTNNVAVCPAKTQISLGIHPVWSESSLCTQWVAKGPSFLHADSKDSDQTGRTPRLICLRWAHTHFLGFVTRWLITLFLFYCN